MHLERRHDDFDESFDAASFNIQFRGPSAQSIDELAQLCKVAISERDYACNSSSVSVSTSVHLSLVCSDTPSISRERGICARSYPSLLSSFLRIWPTSSVNKPNKIQFHGLILRLPSFQRLKRSIPTECGGSPGRHDISISPAFEQDWLRSRPSTVCKRAQCPGLFSWETNKEVVQALVPEVFHEIFDIRAREAVEGFEA